MSRSNRTSTDDTPFRSWNWRSLSWTAGRDSGSGASCCLCLQISSATWTLRYYSSLSEPCIPPNPALSEVFPCNNPNKDLNLSPTGLNVQGGIAYWDGKTDVVQHKGSATRMAKTAGAKGVVNHIKVSDEAKEKAADNLDEGRRRAQVKRSEPRTDK